MLDPTYTRQFRRDLDKMARRGKAPEKAREVMDRLIDGRPLEARNRDHSLKGDWKDHRECHVEPDWLLIYRIEGTEICFVRTGPHAELFKT